MFFLKSNPVCISFSSLVPVPLYNQVIDRDSRPGRSQVLRNAHGRGERQLADEQRPDAGRRHPGDWHPEEVRGTAGQSARLVTQCASVALGCQTFHRVSQPTADSALCGNMSRFSRTSHQEEVTLLRD